MTEIPATINHFYGSNRMKFTDYILIDAITPEIKATNIPGVIREIVQPLLDAGGIEKEAHEEIVKRFIKREELGSTAIGRGIATPETKHPSVKRTIGTIAISAEGTDFDSLDDEKTHIFFPVISPPDRPGDHLWVLEHLTRRLKDETFRESLKQCKTREAIVALLEEDDSNEKR